MDPLLRLAKVAEKEGLWLHVDAAMAGSAMILPELCGMWEGNEGADSLVLNPHKWLGVGFDFSAYYVRDPQHRVRVMSTNPSYLRTLEDGQVTNYRDGQVPLGRRFRALKLWFVLMDQGALGLRGRLRRDLALAQWFQAKVDGAPDWERVAAVTSQTICLRHRPQGVEDEALLAALNLAIARWTRGAALLPSPLAHTALPPSPLAPTLD